MVYKFVQCLLKVLFRLFYRIRVIGYEEQVKNGPVLVCANHLGMMDMFLIAYTYKRQINWMSKEELFRNPILRVLIKSVGAFPVKRGEVDIAAVKQTMKILKQNKIIGIFPEGTRTRNKKNVQPKNGTAMFAIKSGAPIQPILIEGSYRLFSKIVISIGKPFVIEKEDDSNKITKEYLDKRTNDIINSIYGLKESRLV